MWSYPPSKVLVPIDFGDASSRAVEVGTIVASRFGATLAVLHAEFLDAPPYFTRDQLATLGRERAAARSQAEQYLRAFAERLGALGAQVRIVDAAPTPAIVEESGRVDLVVMGTHGRSGPSRWWLGSVAERVVHASHAPVFVGTGRRGPRQDVRARAGGRA